MSPTLQSPPPAPILPPATALAPDHTEDPVLTSRHPLRASLFPHCPPYLRLLPPGQQYSPALPAALQQLAWAAPSGLSPIVADTVTRAGYRLLQVSWTVQYPVNKFCTFVGRNFNGYLRARRPARGARASPRCGRRCH